MKRTHATGLPPDLAQALGQAQFIRAQLDAAHIPREYPTACIACRSKFDATQAIHCTDCGLPHCPVCFSTYLAAIYGSTPIDVPMVYAASVRASVWGRGN